MKRFLFFAAAFVILTACNCFAAEIKNEALLNVYSSMKAGIAEYENAVCSTKVYQDTDACYAQRKYFNFDDGNIFEIYKYDFTDKNYVYDTMTNGFLIPGNEISVKYYDGGRWYKTTKISNLPKKTLFIDTDKYHMVISVPSVYKAYDDSGTAVFSSGLEKPITIEKQADSAYYKIEYTFDSTGEYLGSIWMLKSKNELVDWTDINQLNILVSDLSDENRFLWDGYYFTEPTTYLPYHGSGSIYRHPSSYAAAVFAHYGSFPAAYDLGYAFMYICTQNQNDKGYWATGPRADWLYADFGIDGGFYDTRFNTDFAEGLLYAYERYKNPMFLNSLIKYTEFYMNYAQNNCYKTESGGLLVMDYGYDKEHKDVHCSLNHQLAELNFLYTAYELTEYDGYKKLADKMLLAVEDTCDQWILEDCNLKYALYYTGTSNYMVDYPTLTYNDLFDTKHILKEMFNKRSAAVEKLMAAKLKWMTDNGVTGYSK